MLSLNIDLVIPRLGLTINADNTVELHSSGTISVSLNIPIELLPEDEDLKALYNYTENSNEKVIRNIEEQELVLQARQCIASKGAILCTEGIGGTYFIKDSNGRTIGVFKPVDEEPGALNNPKDLVEDPLLPPGGGAKREVAAYLMDRGRAGVPETHFLTHVNSSLFSNGDNKSGSIQRFVENIGSTASYGTRDISVEDVHNIGILDIRMLNIDRNDENMLLKKEGDKVRLVPIDHTYTLPPTLENVYYEWMYWKQAKVPFSEETKEYISKLDPYSDAQLLRELGIEEESILNMILSTILLKKCAEENLTLFEIASLICRKKPSVMSELEKFAQLSRKDEKLDIAAYEKLVKDHLLNLKAKSL